MPEEIPITDEGTPYIKAEPLAYTTISSWEETSKEIIEFNLNSEQILSTGSLTN